MDRLCRFRWARRLAGHDVIDLLGINGFPFKQRFCHRLHLVPIFLEQATSQCVLLINDAADFSIHLLHRRFGNVLVLRHR